MLTVYVAISTDTERRAGLAAIAEFLVKFCGSCHISEMGWKVMSISAIAEFLVKFCGSCHISEMGWKVMSILLC